MENSFVNLNQVEMDVLLASYNSKLSQQREGEREVCERVDTTLHFAMFDFPFYGPLYYTNFPNPFLDL